MVVLGEEKVEIKVKRVFDPTIELADNAMLKHRPELFDEWDFEKNDELGLDVYSITKGSQRDSWWICKKCAWSWIARTSARFIGNGCPHCAGKIPSETNRLSFTHPQLLLEWNYNKNIVLPSEIGKSSIYKAWWNCPKCDSEYECTVRNRVFGKACSYCHGRKVNHTNSFASRNPNLVKEWNYLKNDDITPETITFSSHKKVWWNCLVCKNEYECSLANKSKGKSCPYCANQKIKIGFNDMWATNPELASLLFNSEDGYKHTAKSNKKVQWNCSLCNKDAGFKTVHKVAERGVKCKNCSESMSFGERLIYNLLIYSKISFKHEKEFQWSEKKRYDFYLKKYNAIIEVHGMQHYKGKGFSGFGGRTVAEEQENDLYKLELAYKNGIEKYIVINTSDGTYEQAKKSVVESNLLTHLNINDRIDWEHIISLSKKRRVLSKNKEVK